MSKIQRNNTVIDPSKPTDLATAISKYTTGGVMLTDAIGELAKSLTILLQDQMGYTTFVKRHNSCKFDLYRECFYYVGKDELSGLPIKNVIHEWQTAGDEYIFADGESTFSATRNEIRKFMKDIGGFLEKLEDDLMSTAAETEGIGSAIGSLADRLRTCNLIILKRQQDRPDRGPSQDGEDSLQEKIYKYLAGTPGHRGACYRGDPSFATGMIMAMIQDADRPDLGPSFEIPIDGEDNMIEPFVEIAMNGIHAVDLIPQTSMEDRHAKYAKLIWSEMALAFRRGVAYGKQQDRPDPGPYVDSKDNQLEPFLEAAMNAIRRIDEADQTLPQPYTKRHTEYGEVLWCELRNVHRHGVDQGAAALNATGRMEIPPYEDQDRCAFKGSVSVEGIRFFSSDSEGKTRRCVKCGDILDLFVIKVLDKPVAVVGLCSKGETYLYLPSEYPVTEDIRQP